jgi:riboflavin synthase alpha subunit
MTNLATLKPGDPVNLEADLIAKYVERMIEFGVPALAGSGKIRHAS